MKELKWLADYVIEFSDMSESAKEIAFNYIKEADDVQIAHLLLTGKMVVEVKNPKKVISEFRTSPAYRLLTEEEKYYPTTGRKTAMSVAGLIFGLGPVWWAVYRTIRASFDQCTEKCGTYKINTRERQVCMAKSREERDKKMAALKTKAKAAKAAKEKK